MSYYVIGGEDTVLGFSYVGVPGRVVESAAEAAEAAIQSLDGVPLSGPRI